MTPMLKRRTREIITTVAVLAMPVGLSAILPLGVVVHVK